MKAIDAWNDMRLDLRRSRADQVIAAVMHELGSGYEFTREQIYRALFAVLYESGIDILTDAMRAEIGLPPRDEKGWTAQEAYALELKRLEGLMKPLVYEARLGSPNLKSGTESENRSLKSWFSGGNNV